MRSRLSLSRTLFALLTLLSAPALFASCGGGGDSGGGFLPLPTGAYSISGTVTDGTNGLAGVTISISGTGSGSITTDANGNFTVSRLFAGTYTLTPSMINSRFDPASRTVTLSASTAGINFTKLIQDAQEGAGGDNTSGTASTFTINGPPQVRTLYPDGDEDWARIDFSAVGEYEFSVNRLSNVADTIIELYNNSLVKVVPTTTCINPSGIDCADDYIGLDSRIRHTVDAGIYYLRILTASPWAILQENNGVATYTLDVHLFNDGDGDGYSSYYDCDDTAGSGSNIHPGATDDPATTIDEDCTAGYNQFAATTADSAEPDDNVANAKPMAVAGADGWEVQYRADIFSANARTLHQAGDTDIFSITVPAKSAVYVQLAKSFTVGTAGLGDIDAAQVDGSGAVVTTLTSPTVLNANDLTSYVAIMNTTDLDGTYYVKFNSNAGETGYYVPFYYNVGTDNDDDGYFTNDWPGYRDCDDSNSSINPGAITDAPADGIDQNCNGVDGS